MESQWLNYAVSGVGLLVSVFLLVEALTVRKVAFGGAIADKISYVLLATLCLAASSLANWIANFVQGVTLEQTRLAADVLVIVAMALLGVYFYSVRAAMQRYLRELTGGERLRREAQDEAADEAPAVASADDGREA